MLWVTTLYVYLIKIKIFSSKIFELLCWVYLCNCKLIFIMGDGMPLSLMVLSFLSVVGAALIQPIGYPTLLLPHSRCWNSFGESEGEVLNIQQFLICSCNQQTYVAVPFNFWSMVISQIVNGRGLGNSNAKSCC